MCMGADKLLAAVPWADVVKNPSDFFDDTYWPADVQLVEPSKMGKGDATALLDFWSHRQQQNLRPTFCFKAWKDTDGELEKPAKSFQKAIWCAARHGKGKGTRQPKHASRRQDQDEQSADEEEVEEEHQSSPDDDEAPMSAHDRDQSFPPKVTQRGRPPMSSDGGDDASVSHTLTPHINDSADTYHEVTKPAKSKMTGDPPVPPKHKPVTLGGHTTRQGLRSKVGNEPATRASKRHAAAPISDTPAKRTRSKAAVAEAPKAKCSRK